LASSNKKSERLNKFGIKKSSWIKIKRFGKRFFFISTAHLKKAKKDKDLWV